MSKEVATLAERNGVSFVDAPVSGGMPVLLMIKMAWNGFMRIANAGVIAAKAGTLTFMVGGPEKEFTRAKPVLSGMGKNIVHCGPIGSGQTAKICNNMLLAITMIGTAEAFNLGIRLGLDAKLLSGIINTSTGRSWSSEVYNPVPGVLDNVPASNGYKGGFSTSLIAKDLGLAQNSALRSHSAIPLGSMAHQLYRLMAVRGYGQSDFSSIYQFLQEQMALNGTSK